MAGDIGVSERLLFPGQKDLEAFAAPEPVLHEYGPNIQIALSSTPELLTEAAESPMPQPKGLSETEQLGHEALQLRLSDKYRRMRHSLHSHYPQIFLWSRKLFLFHFRVLLHATQIAPAVHCKFLHTLNNEYNVTYPLLCKDVKYLLPVPGCSPRGPVHNAAAICGILFLEIDELL
jgi:hypothetical protein